MTEVLAVCQGERWPRGGDLGHHRLRRPRRDDPRQCDRRRPRPAAALRRARRAEQVIGRITGDGNPFDAWGNGNYAVNLPHAMSVVDKSERIDAVVYCADTSNEGHLGHPGRVLENVKMLADAAKSSHKPYYLMSSRPGVMNAQQAKGMREAAWCRSAARARAWRDRPRRPLHDGANRPDIGQSLRCVAGSPTCSAPSRAGGPSTNTTPSASWRIRRAGDAGASVATLAEATQPPARSATPSCSRWSRTTSRTRPSSAWSRRPRGRRRSRARFTPARAARTRRAAPSDAAFLVQEFVADGIEVFAGVSRDPDFGLTLAFGMGGIAIEVTRDFALRMLPLREGDAEAMIAETRGAAMLGSIAAAGGRRRQPRRLPLCACGLRPMQCRHARRDRSQSDQGAAGRTRLRRGGCLDRREIASAR